MVKPMKIVLLKKETEERGKPVFGGFKSTNIIKAMSGIHMYPLEQDTEIVHDVIYLLMDYYKANKNEDVFNRFYDMMLEPGYVLGNGIFQKELEKVLEEDKELIEKYTERPTKKLEDLLEERGFMGNRKLNYEYKEIEHGTDS